ncbi:MAG TPA: hypothetical protein VHA06_01815, partial [Candidatus Angelobacter sp.]|nr:hypothetical protein [Candidatus Angelobacter sp.]
QIPMAILAQYLNVELPTPLLQHEPAAKPSGSELATRPSASEPAALLDDSTMYRDPLLSILQHFLGDAQAQFKTIEQ